MPSTLSGQVVYSDSAVLLINNRQIINAWSHHAATIRFARAAGLHWTDF